MRTAWAPRSALSPSFGKRQAALLAAILSGHLLSLEFDTLGEEQPVSCSSGRVARRKGGGAGV